MLYRTFLNHRFFFTLLFLTLACTCVSAQLKISRQVLGTAVYSTTPNGSRLLKMTATAGEVFVGTQQGDIKATVGFQQPDDDIRTALVTVGEKTYTINAFPNPASTSLTIEMGSAAKDFRSLELLDVLGRVMIQRRTDSTFSTTIELTEVSTLPSGNYYLRGLDQFGQRHLLGNIVIATH